MLLLSRPRPGRLRYHDELSFLILSGGGGGGGVLQRPGRMRGDVYNYNYHWVIIIIIIISISISIIIITIIIIIMWRLFRQRSLRNED